jgi:hypothetical protein
MQEYSNQIITLHLKSLCSAGGTVESPVDGGQRLSIPSGPAGEYRLAQLDDTQNRSRREFNWQSPCTLELQARVSAADLPGTWGFGLWNDPFTASLIMGGGTRKLPTLPQTAWFFHASSANWLSLRDDLPANGFLAATFSSRKVSPLLLAPAVLATPLLFWRVSARGLRRLARRWIKADSTSLTIDPTNWHTYQLNWLADSVSFQVDGQAVLKTAVAPHGPLGLVVWIDNQYAAFTPQGRLAYGTQANLEAAWLEIEGLQITSGG